MWSPKQTFDADASNDSSQYNRQSPFSSLFPQRLLNSAEMAADEANTSAEGSFLTAKYLKILENL